MSKKVVYAILALVVVIAIVAVGALFLGKGTSSANIDLQKLNETLSQKPPFNEMATMDIDAETLAMAYEINKEDVEEVIGKMPLMNVHASMYLVIKAADGKVEAVKEKVDQYASTQEEMWSTYLPEQYALVQARKSGTVGNYVYLFISENAAELEGLMK